MTTMKRPKRRPPHRQTGPSVQTVSALALYLCVGFGGCADGGEAFRDDASRSDGASTGQTTLRYMRGIYFVPERSDVSTYPVGEASWTVTGQHVELAYNLPRMLVGQSVRVALAGPLSADGKTATLSGKVGTATCSVAPDLSPISCTERFVGLQVDLDKVRKRAEAQDPTRVDQRVEVARRFANHPIGVYEREVDLYGPAPAPTCTSDVDCPGSRCDLEDAAAQGFCEPAGGAATLGQPCQLGIDCSVELSCEHEEGPPTCQPRGRDS